MDESGGEKKNLTKKLGFHQLVFTFIHYKEILEKKKSLLFTTAILPFPRKMKNVENACAEYGGML
jgi:hypothetical protein